MTPGIAALALALAAVVLVACGAASSDPLPAASPPPEPAQTVVVCLSTARTYEAYLAPTAREIAGGLLASITPGYPGAEVYLRLVTHSSYDGRNLVGRIGIPRVQAQAVLPTPVATSNNPFAPPSTATAVAPDTRAEAAAQAVRRLIEPQLHDLQTIDRAALVAKGKVEPDIALTDFWGCLQAARDVFDKSRGRDLLVIATDFEDNYDPAVCQRFHLSPICDARLKPPGWRIDGAEVAIVGFNCPDPITCAGRRGFWGHDALTTNGARCAEFYQFGEPIADAIAKQACK